MRLVTRKVLLIGGDADGKVVNVIAGSSVYIGRDRYLIHKLAMMGPDVVHSWFVGLQPGVEPSAAHEDRVRAELPALVTNAPDALEGLGLL